jgi:hypothetical protein
VRAGAAVRLRLAVRNVLHSPAYDLVVAVSLPARVRVTSARVPFGNCSRGRQLRCRIPYLAPSAQVSADAVLRPRRCGRVAIGASVRAVEGDLTPANNERRTALLVRC